MSKIKQLIQSYSNYIAIPWRSDSAAAQRVIFCVYNEADELPLRAKIDEFEFVTRQSEHEWVIFDLTDTFADWLVNQRYAKSYFKKPDLLSILVHKYYLKFITQEFEKFLQTEAVNDNTVVALKGAGSLFGFIKVKEVVDKFAPLVKGRLLLFFPGSHENNNYRLLDGYDGWNYHAFSITADKDF